MGLSAGAIALRGLGSRLVPGLGQALLLMDIYRHANERNEVREEFFAAGGTWDDLRIKGKPMIETQPDGSVVFNFEITLPYSNDEVKEMTNELLKNQNATGDIDIDMDELYRRLKQKEEVKEEEIEPSNLSPKIDNNDIVKAILSNVEEDDNGNIPLWRSVGPDEAALIEATQRFWPSPAGLLGKYFSATEEGARFYAKQAEENLNDPPYTLFETSFPKEKITPEMLVDVDSGVPGVVIPNNKLDLLTPPINKGRANCPDANK